MKKAKVLAEFGVRKTNLTIEVPESFPELRLMHIAQAHGGTFKIGVQRAYTKSNAPIGQIDADRLSEIAIIENMAYDWLTEPGYSHKVETRFF